MKIFFDEEFTGLTKDNDLISVGLISENNDIFYAEFSDYDINKCSDWVKDNVIANLMHTYDNRILYGDKQLISKELQNWLDKFENIEFISDVCHYDFVNLIDLITDNALNFKYNAVCHDINQDIAKYYNISEKEAFDKNRENIIDEIPYGEKHNSLYDAKVIKMIYERIWGNEG